MAETIVNQILEKEMKGYTDFIRIITKEIADLLIKKDAEYGGSWLKRGGVGAYMMKVRKSDRLEQQVQAHGYDIFLALRNSQGKSENLADTLLDDAGYAILILAEARARGITGE
jgi:hypothetical protein